MNIPDEAVEAVQAAHGAICEQNFDDCLEWRGKCVKAVEAAAPLLMAQAWDEAVASLIYEDGTKVELSQNGNPYRSSRG